VSNVGHNALGKIEDLYRKLAKSHQQEALLVQYEQGLFCVLMIVFVALRA